MGTVASKPTAACGELAISLVPSQDAAGTIGVEEERGRLGKVKQL